MSTTFRKKPVEIEARQFNGSTESANEVLAWIGSNGGSALRHSNGIERLVQITTLEGEMTASPGDWIIRGVQGEFYPCKPDIFAETYEATAEVTEEGAAARAAAHDRAVERFFTASNAIGVVALRDLIVALGTEIDIVVPPGRNKALALTALEDVQMRGNRGIFAPEHLR